MDASWVNNENMVSISIIVIVNESMDECCMLCYVARYNATCCIWHDRRTTVGANFQINISRNPHYDAKERQFKFRMQ